MVKLTAITSNILLNKRLDRARPRLVDSLGLEAGTTSSHAAGGIHGLLERIALPPEDVVAVLAETGVVARGEDEGLGSVGRPLGLVVELGRVPDHLVHELRNPDRVRGRTAPA